MFKKTEEKENGKQPEEIAMMPARGWGSDGEVQGSEEETRCRPSFLQRFAGVWTFVFMVALGALGGDGLLLLLKFQADTLRRQFDVDADTVLWLSYSSEIACVISAVFLSILAKKIHLPRALAICSVVIGIAGLLCVIPYGVTKGNLVPAPKVMENQTYSIEKYKMMSPTCIENKKAMAVVQRLMMEAMASKSAQKPHQGSSNKQAQPQNMPTETQNKPTQPPKPSEVKAMGADVTTDSNWQNASEPSASEPPSVGRTITMPDFQKLSTHPNFKNFVQMAEQMGIDLEEVAAMDVDGQVNYVENLPPNVRNMLPSLKMVLGDDADSYFMQVHVDDTGSRRVKRSATKGRINLDTDMAYNGQMVQLMKRMPPIPPEIMKKAAKELCPLNTGPFMVNSSTGVLKIINVAMILQGIARGPRLAYAASFLLENSSERSLSLHFGVLLGVSFLCQLIAMLVSLYSSTMHITLEDVGFMTVYHPRWLPAWWLGFALMAILTIFSAAPLFFFPKKLKGPRKYVATTNDDRSCFSLGAYIKDLLASFFRLFTNPVYLAVVLGTLFSIFPWGGLLHILFNYVTQQFQLEPFMPGLYLVIAFIIIFGVGIIIGGVISSKYRLSSLSHLKLALGLACCLVIIQACNLGLGCSEPSIDKGQRIVPNKYSGSNETNCGSTCPCSDMGFAPACGSDGKTYYSPCHAGCGEGYEGKFHDCKCIEDKERTATPGHCPNCNLHYPFFVVFCLGGFILGLQVVPWLTATFRSVKVKDVPVALGLLIALVICVVSIPSPVVYHTMEDAQCTGRMFECGLLNTCVRYNIKNVRLHTFGLSLASQAVSAILFTVAFVFGRKSSVFQEQVYVNDQVKS